VFEEEANAGESEEWIDESYVSELPPPRRAGATRSKNAGRRPGQMPSGIWVLIGAGICLAMIAVVVPLVVPLVLNRRGGEATVDAAGGVGPTVNPGAPVTDKECVVFATALEEAVEKDDHAAFQKLMNYGAVIDKALHGLELTEKQMQELSQGISSAFPKAASQLFVDVKEGSYEHLHTLSDGEIKQVLFRLNGESGLNYHRFDLIRNSAGKIVSGDQYIFASGEYLSTSLRRMMLPAVANINATLLDRLTGRENAIVKNVVQIARFNAAVQAGRHREVLREYSSFPESLRSGKSILLMRLKSAQEVSESEHVVALADFQKHYPNDDCLNLLLIDYHLLKKQFGKCYEVIDRLDRSVEGDLFLETLRATIMLAEGRNAEARRTLTPLLNNERLGKIAHEAMLDVDLAERNHKATVATLQTLQQEYGYDFGNLSAIPEFAEFVESPEYRQWRSGVANESVVQTVPSMSRESSVDVTARPSEAATKPQPPTEPKPESRPKPKPETQPEISLKTFKSVYSSFTRGIVRKNVTDAATQVAQLEGYNELIATLEEVVQDDAMIDAENYFTAAFCALGGRRQ